MSERSVRRLGRLLTARSGLPTERDWERSVLLEPRTVADGPALVSDGAGLPFAPAALTAPAGELAPDDPAVAALAELIARQTPAGADSPMPGLDGWRMLARADDEVLFGHGLPPHLITVAMRREGRRDAWTSVAVSTGRPLRATRDGARASGWRIDPNHEPEPGDTTLYVLVTEQTAAGGARADRRLLAPDLLVGAEEVVLTMFVTPLQGFQLRSPNPETPARVPLGGEVGARRLRDGALYPVG